MIKKKDIDISSIVKQSLLEAKKDMGLLKEANADPAAIEKLESQFNIEDHTSFIKLLPKKWGMKGTVQANEIDAVIDSIVGNMPPGIVRFKECIKKMNSILGKTPGEQSFPVQGEAVNADLRSMFGALQLNHLLYSIIHAQDASVAGKMFEGLASRMFGGQAEGGNDIIQDASYGNKLVSLKVIDPNASNIEGSKFNLAKGIATSNDGEVTYLVCEKDKKNDPFSFRSYTFTINKDNFFEFILHSKDKGITDDDVRKAIGNLVSEGISTVSINETKEDNPFQKAILQYVKTKNLNGLASKEDPTKEEVDAALAQYLNPIFNDALSKTDTFFTQELPQIASLKGAIAASSNALKEKRYDDVLAGLNTLRNFATSERPLSDIDKANYFEEDPEVLRKLTDPNVPRTDKEAILSDKKRTYNEKLNKILSSIVPLRTFVSDIERIKKNQTKANLKPVVHNVSSDIKEQFWKDLASGKIGRAESIKDSRFSITSNQIRVFAASVGATVDESIPDFIVEPGFLFNSSQENTDRLRSWIEPIYKNFFMVDNALKAYYINDNSAGMTKAGEYTDKLRKSINDHPGSQGEAASQLKESKQKNLTKHWSSDILDWVQK